MRGRTSIIVLLIVSLLATGATSQFAFNRRQAAIHRPGQLASSDTGAASLAGMNSYALALLLGGLRGPLVMMLWSSSEAQKNEKNLEDFDTKVEWIRLLQPEFDTVHIFQIWNKAYNISVQMASLANKYATILDALDYARKIDRQKPNDINIVEAIGQIYFDKLGNSAEKDYYQQRVRDETQWRPPERSHPGDIGWRRTRLDPILDQKGYLLSELVKPRIDRPSNLPADSEWNNGAEYQYLQPYQPFPYGVSTFAIAYNYYKQAQVLQTVGKQRHIQLSSMVVDSRPALALESWGRDEWTRGRQAELKAFDKNIPAERLDMEMATASLPLNATTDQPELIDAALYSYQLIPRLCHDSIAEFRRHLLSYSTNFWTYMSHIDELQAIADLTQADHDYLAALRATGKEREQLLQSAGHSYAAAVAGYRRIILKYYVDQPILDQILPNDITKETVDKIPAGQLQSLLYQVQRILQARPPGINPHTEDVAEYHSYIDRGNLRLAQITAGH
ncbi:MAG: hypothetical protein IT446_05195 [Phycisphaerales bacterium]|nr:hypothetical protein [Phycisphaerales bacterium]